MNADAHWIATAVLAALGFVLSTLATLVYRDFERRIVKLEDKVEKMDGAADNLGGAVRELVVEVRTLKEAMPVWKEVLDRLPKPKSR